MNFVQLKTLMQVAELGSLNKASDRLRIAQPALSRQIRLLEQELGVTLFRRHGHGMVLTEVGQKVLARAGRIIQEVDELRDEVSVDRTQLSGSVSIGLPPTVAELMTVPVAREFRAAHPRVKLRFVTAFTGHLLEWLQRGDIDLAVLYDPQPSRSLRSRPLLLESLFAVGTAEQEFSLVRAVSFAALARRPLLLPSSRHGLRALVEKAARENGIQLEVPIEADSLATLKELALKGMGQTIMPLATIHAEIAAGRLTAAPLIEPALSRRLVLASSRERAMRRSALELSKTLARVLTELVQGGKWVGRLIDGTYNADPPHAAPNPPPPGVAMMKVSPSRICTV